jgi:hypothetical protein
VSGRSFSSIGQFQSGHCVGTRALRLEAGFISTMRAA